MAHPQSSPVLRTLLVLGYILLLLTITGAMFWSRRESIRRFGSDRAHANWQTWRHDVESGEAHKPVDREVPTSTSPPVLILLRDYFGSCLVMALVMSSILYGTLAFMLVGVISNRSRGGHRAE